MDLSKNTVRTDYFDRETWQEAMAQTEGLPEAVARCKAELGTCDVLAEDLFADLYKMHPELLPEGEVQQGYRFNRTLVQRAQEMPEHAKLRSMTKLDPLQSVLGASMVLEHVTKSLSNQEKEKLKDQAEQAERLQERLDKLQQDLANTPPPQQPETPDPHAQQRQQAQEAIQAVKAEVAALDKQAQSLVDASAQRVRAAMRQGLAKAAEEARDLIEFAAGYGVEPGELRRLPFEERVALAKRLRGNPKLRAVAKELGRVRRLAFARQQARVKRVPSEIVGIIQGDSIVDALVSEKALLADPDLEVLFWRRYVAGELLQHDHRGRAKVGKGPIIACYDGSGSMNGAPETWAKAVVIALADLARSQGRDYAAIQFGSKGQLKTWRLPREQPEKERLNAILEVAEFWFSGGPLRIDQRAATPQGWKPIGTIQPGDYVFGLDGRPEKVLGVYPQGKLNVYRMRLNDGTEIICDGKHKWTVEMCYSAYRGKRITLTTEQMLERGLYLNSASQYRFRLPLAAPLQLPEADLPLDPYLLGYLLGDGSLSSTTPKISVAAGEERPWMSVLPTGIVVTEHEKRPGFAHSLALKGTRAGKFRNPVTQALRELGLFGIKELEKHVPDQYLWASASQRLAMLQGLCDSDGHAVKSGGAEYTSVSKRLANDVAHLARSLGGIATLKRRVPSRAHELPLYRVQLSFPDGTVPFRMKRKAGAYRQRQRPIARSIVAIESAGTGECVCIRVDRKDGLFLTEGLAPTHNTDFETPLDEAVKVLSESKFNSADIVFITDGECRVTDEWLRTYRAAKQTRGFRTFGILIGTRPPQVMRDLCDVCLSITNVYGTTETAAMDEGLFVFDHITPP